MEDRPAKQLPIDIEEYVFNHLLFHRSLIDDDSSDGYSRLDRYMEVLSQMKDGAHVAIRDSYSRSIAMIMELAIDEYLDPWDVDLVRFCKLFMDRLTKSERVNLLVVGKLISMAYSVHLLKSENTLKKAEVIEEDEPFDEGYSEWMEDDESFRVTTGIIRSRDVIMESLVRKGDRPVTLLDLLEALEDVEEEVKVLKESRSRHVEQVKRMDIASRTDIDRKMFSENIEEEIKLTWQRVNQFNGHPIPFSTIHRDFQLDETSTFISLLHLANWSRIMLSQRTFPKGEIFVKNIARGKEDGLEFGELETNIDKASSNDSRLIPPGELIIEERPIPPNWNT
ncbi:MAG: hypothetical protein QCI82_09085 [Candidatus Thermoplasmatota archaeon]|nr:hypothetical protein [Candidatus Thermoplasmatota archaeon]